MEREVLSENGAEMERNTPCHDEVSSLSIHFSSMESEETTESEYSVYTGDYRYPESQQSFDFSSQKRNDDEWPMEMTPSQEYFISVAEEMERSERNELRDQLSDLRISPLTQEVNEALEFEEHDPSQKYFEDMADAYDAEPDLMSENVPQSQENYPSSDKYFQNMPEQIEADETNELPNEFFVRRSSEQNYYEDMADAYDADPDLTPENVSQSQEWADTYFTFFERCSQCGQHVCLREGIENGYANDFCVNCM